jgi:hypothetical protein
VRIRDGLLSLSQQFGSDEKGALTEISRFLDVRRFKKSTIALFDGEKVDIRSGV